jgi:RimJ/RimL family protein N-acetyltransferase
MIKFLDWDTKFFSFNVAQIISKNLYTLDFEKKLKILKDKKIKLLQYKCDINDEKNLDAAQRNNFKYVDLRIQYKKKIKLNIESKKYLLSVAKKKDISILKKKFASRFNFTRYYTDNNFDKKKILEFYKNWIERSVKGQFDDYTLLMKEKNKIIGFCTLKERSNNSATIGLVSVIKSKNQYGLKLIKGVENFLFLKGIKKLYVVTQGRNHQAQKLYDRCFFKIDKVKCYYHLWL